MSLDRRSFLKQMAGGGVVIIACNFLGCSSKQFHINEKNEGQVSAIIADYLKCTGCRTCECVCSSFNHRQDLNGEMLPGLGNPYHSNIQVTTFHPDIDIPLVCTMCIDAPCINSCPVEPDNNGEKALYKDRKTGTVKCHMDRCIGCGSCRDACKSESIGIIHSDPETNMPKRMCTLCDGDPQCVRYCPGEALSYISVNVNDELYRLNPDAVAEKLYEKWYVMKRGGAK